MQDLEGLRPFDAAVRLLPQALMGLLFSPLVGLIMHKVPGTLLLTLAATALVASNVLLIFLRRGDNYLIWIFPSVMLSTIGMDWTMNVGSVSILLLLKLEWPIGIAKSNDTVALHTIFSSAKASLHWSFTSPNSNSFSCSSRYGSHYSNLVIIRRERA